MPQGKRFNLRYFNNLMPAVYKILDTYCVSAVRVLLQNNAHRCLARLLLNWQEWHLILNQTFIVVDCVWNVMAHAQKQDFIFRRKGRVHLNRQGCQFSRLLAAEVCASVVVMLDTPCSEVVWRVLATHSIRQFPLHFPSLRHSVPSHFNWTLYASFSVYGCSHSTKSPASGITTVSEPRVMSQVGRVREVVCA